MPQRGPRLYKVLPIVIALAVCASPRVAAAESPDEDWMYQLQSEAVEAGVSPAANWGPDPERYSSWTTHSNRLIPVYTYGTAGGGHGVDLLSYIGENSAYRDVRALARLSGRHGRESLNPTADYLDQTNLFDLQMAALKTGRKYIFLVVFDGMDWETTRAASVWNLGQVAYNKGRGTGTHFQDYDAGGTSQFGWMVTSPYCDRMPAEVDGPAGFGASVNLTGGYDATLGGAAPWAAPSQIEYLIEGPPNAALRHAKTDSAASATSMNCGIKTFNEAIGVDVYGVPQTAVAHHAQLAGYRVGVVTSVPISHATPAATYAHQTSRDEFQQISRDLLGLPSASHPEQPLVGMDVVIGTGHGVESPIDPKQGDDFVPGNVYLTDADREKIDAENGGAYIVAQRTAGQDGGQGLQAAAERAADKHQRLLGFYGVGGMIPYLSGHLPFASANGDYRPAPGIDGRPMRYTAADLAENPSLAEMTTAALTVLGHDGAPFWLMVEAGDVDWANHSNNLDAAIGAVNSGDEAVRVITRWVEEHSNWDESLMIVTADHGHYLFLDRPELLIPPSSE
ncbi:MAG: alkaline phosphatase [Planctomycetales bacterium]|nr:alkaline phosphatase [Planctomycetales bacterium]